ncbi:MAG TPA: rod shape-determining protein MreC [Candidatus Methylacidiphilales bacterium]|nr:rod shape-determining protein MreC [Candidatus Methylacidiphilales bacterium]
MLKKVSYFALVILGVLVVLGILQPESVRSDVRSRSLDYFGPALSFLDWGAAKVALGNTEFKTVKEAAAEVDRLRKENAEMQVKMQLAGDLQKKVDSLQEQLNFKKESMYSVVAARVIGRDPVTWWNKLIINRGHNDNITPDMPVVTPRGVIGKVGIVKPDFAEVILMIDTNCKISSVIQETNEQGIVVGEGSVQGEGNFHQGKPRAKITFISRKAQIGPNQLVYTSSMGGVFPPGLPVGIISEIVNNKQSNFGLYQEALVEPVVDFSKIDHVFVITGVK